MQISKSDSMKITSLRFLLMCFIVFIHSCLPIKYAGRVELIQICFTQWAVPAVYIFFLISGYLLFLKNDPYKILLKKKAKGLLLPYLLWPTMWLVIMVLPKLIASIFFASRLQNPWEFYNTGWSFTDYLKYYFFYDDTWHHPYWAQFWFIRQLIFMVILSPLIRLAARRFALPVLIVLLTFVMGGFSAIPDLGFIYIYISPLLFFFLGALCAVSGFSFFDFADKNFKWKVLLPLFALFFAGENILQEEKASVFFKAADFLRCIILLKFSSLLIPETDADVQSEKKIFEILKKLNSYSFFLFAIHMGITIPFLSKIFAHFFDLNSDLNLLLHFFFVSFGSIIISVFAGMILRKFFPKLFALFCGGR
jgi:peptidoglycan/LPS O-acetylase OafA/YrhL